MDLERDRFIVHTKGNVPSEQEMVRVVEDAGFGSTVVDDDDSDVITGAEPTVYEPSTIPEPVKGALEKASKEGKLVLVDFFAEWCIPCKRMDEVYKDARLTVVLEGFVFLKVDTDEYPEASNFFKVSGIPDARILDPGGHELTRFLGFKPAEELLTLLRGLNEREGE